MSAGQQYMQALVADLVGKLAAEMDAVERLQAENAALKELEEARRQAAEAKPDA